MTTPQILATWQGKTAVLATMHGKECVIAPVVEKELGLHIKVPTDFNTDQFGTFTRDIKRTGSQLEAARKKALAAMQHTQCDLGIASEGSFGSHPSLPFVASNLELVILIDRQNELEIVGHHRTNGLQVRSKWVTSPAEAVQVARDWDFPTQGVIVRAKETSNANIYKEIRTLDELHAVSERLLSRWFTTRIFLETDMRAHRCPARMEAIRLATLDLITNCQSHCPICSTPGFVITKTIEGLPCRDCHLPTDITKEVVYTCARCHHEEHRPATNTPYAEPGVCARCNP